MLGCLTLALISNPSLIVAGKAKSLLNQARHCSTEKKFSSAKHSSLFLPHCYLQSFTILLALASSSLIKGQGLEVSRNGGENYLTGENH
jgi:hypothetical protein